MASNLNAITTGIGGIETAPDNSGILHLQSDGTTIANVHSSGTNVTGTISATLGWSGTGSNAGVLGGSPMAFNCERNGVDTVGNNLSFGNGDVDNRGGRMPFNGKLYCASLQATQINGTGTYQLLVNNSLESSYELSVTGSTTDEGVTQYFATPYSFSAGDYISWKCTTAAASQNGLVVLFFVVFD